jgi:membrane protease YdiL (CAAX protease family)
VAVAFETALLGLAFLLGWIVGTPALGAVGLQWPAVALGGVATLPLLVGMALVAGSSWEPFERLSREIEETVAPLFLGCSPLVLALVSLAAGVGEEALFRGVIQAALGSATHPAVGLLGASVLFGLTHLVTRTYALLAGVLGLYLGAITMISGNLVPAIVAHALYDFVALLYWTRAASAAAEPTP